METFKIRTYGRTELAQLYSPGLCPQAAFRKLNQWIDFHTAEQPPCTGRLEQNADIHAGASTAHSRGVGRTVNYPRL